MEIRSQLNHYDHVGYGTRRNSRGPVGQIHNGADDNASGSTGVMVAAEILSQYEFERTIRYVFFTGEEQGLYGSREYADLVAGAGDNIVAVYNMDMIAWNADGTALHFQYDSEGNTRLGVVDLQGTPGRWTLHRRSLSSHGGPGPPVGSTDARRRGKHRWEVARHVLSELWRRPHAQRVC